MKNLTKNLFEYRTEFTIKSLNRSLCSTQCSDHLLLMSVVGNTDFSASLVSAIIPILVLPETFKTQTGAYADR